MKKNFNADKARMATLEALTGPRFAEEMDRQHQHIRAAAELGERWCKFRIENGRENGELWYRVKAALISEGYKVTTRGSGIGRVISW